MLCKGQLPIHTSVGKHLAQAIKAVCRERKAARGVKCVSVTRSKNEDPFSYIVLCGQCSGQILEATSSRGTLLGSQMFRTQ